MRPVRNVFQKLSRTEQRREGVVAYLWSKQFAVLAKMLIVFAKMFAKTGRVK